MIPKKSEIWSLNVSERRVIGAIRKHKFDKPEYSERDVIVDMPSTAPKLKALLDKIKELDAIDMKESGHKFKHFIYSDIKSSYGAKLIAAALKADGMNHAYKLEKSSKGMTFKIDEQGLRNNESNTFATLTSVLFFDKPIGVRFKKDLLSMFNSRPNNTNGNNIRIIILDSGFREGVDLFDIKYVHLFEPILTSADQKQAVGRATRFCGQKGLRFDQQKGWPIHVYKYETIIPKEIKDVLKLQLPALAESNTFLDIFMKYSNLDLRKLNFSNELERVTIAGAVDKKLTRAIHDFSINKDEHNEEEGGKEKSLSTGTNDNHAAISRYVEENFSQYTWPQVVIENGCITPHPPSTPLDLEVDKKSSLVRSYLNKTNQNALSLTPTQNFIRKYFTPSSPQLGMLLWHSVGTGKCWAEDTPILMFDGSIKRVQDVKVGDIVMGDDSTKRTVLSLGRGRDDMYDICSQKGDKYTVNSEHILCLKPTRLGVKYIKKQVNLPYSAPYSAHYIDCKSAKIVNKSFPTKLEANAFLDGIHTRDNILEIEVNDYLKLPKYIIKDLKGYKVGVDFPSKPVNYDPYMIGYWLGDESKREPVISTRDARVLKYIRTICQ